MTDDHPGNRCEGEGCNALLADSERTLGRLCSRCLRATHATSDLRACTCHVGNACRKHDDQINRELAELEAIERFRASVGPVRVRRGDGPWRTVRG